MKLFSLFSKDKKNVPVIYQVGWWPHQHILEITSFEVTIIKSQLNLLNSISLISYTIKGWLGDHSGGMPYIQCVHHSEQLIPVPAEFSEAEQMTEIPVHACIQITPVVKIRNDKKHIAQRVPFECTNEYKIRSLRWGKNCFQFNCGSFHTKIFLSQRK